MNIGTNITNLRKNHNLTQEELAKLINVSPKTISSYETNRSLPNIETLILLSQVFNTNIDSIIDLNTENIPHLTKAYQKKNLKETIFKFTIITLILIIPIIFFWWNGYVAIAAYSAKIIALPEKEITEIATETLRLFTYSTQEYFIYLLIMALNYLLYKTKKLKPLIILNTILLIIIIHDLILNEFITFIDLLIFLFAAIVGLICAFKISKSQN